MRTKESAKTTWSIRVDPQLREWYEALAKSRMTDSAEEVRRVLAEYRLSQIANKKKENT